MLEIDTFFFSFKTGYTNSSVNHVQNLGLDKLQILSVPSRSTADDIVNLDIVILSTHATYRVC